MRWYQKLLGIFRKTNSTAHISFMCAWILNCVLLLPLTQKTDLFRWMNIDTIMNDSVVTVSLVPLRCCVWNNVVFVSFSALCHSNLCLCCGYKMYVFAQIIYDYRLKITRFHQTNCCEYVYQVLGNWSPISTQMFTF